MGQSMSWGEAVRLVIELMRDPTSATCAAALEAMSAETRMVDDSGQKRIGNPGGRSPEEVRAMLREMGHKV